MFTKNNELNDNQKAYKDYYSKRLINVFIWEIFFIAIPLLNWISISSISKVPVQLHYFIMGVIILGIIISTVWSLYWIGKQLKQRYSTIITIVIEILFILSVFLLFWTIYGHIGIFIHVMSIYIPITLGIVSLALEIILYIFAKKILPNITLDKSEEHTAIILPHDAKKIMDVSDFPVPRLIKVLKKYHENFQIYFCLYEENIISVLTKPKIENIKRIWIFGHGDRGGCSLTDKYFSYEEFMTEKNEYGEKLHNIQPMEYVYQCHCNPESTTPLTEYLLKSKGVLDPEIYPDNYPDDDKMKNYYDSGLSDMKINSKGNRLLSLDAWFYKGLGKLLHEDSNYNDPLSINYIIKKYETHLENKSKLSNKAIDE
ncbi:MAG: hypothetical protein K6G85_11170 [Eubacterium sp.]|nr:hypothetical protein [Eubacterium sp.]